ncbi:MAG: hypothetical protein CMK59_12635 [Proteobacteria bacterium]|nr:hypothetical protein [Pseudomonadota bacterium]
MAQIVEHQKAHFGLWKGEIRSVDPRDYRRGELSDLWLPLREKRWQYIGIYTEELIFGAALVHASYVGNVFCYLYDRKREVFWEQERVAPLAAGIRVDRNVARGVCSYVAEDERIRIDNDIDKGIRSVDLRLRAEGRTMRCSFEIQDSLETMTPLQVVTPTNGKDFTFTHKSAGMPVLGEIRLGEFRYHLNPKKDFAVLDMSFGYPAQQTEWNWASFAGFADDGRRIGLNLVSPVFHEKFNENAFWIDGELIKLGCADFSYSETDKQWKIVSQGGEGQDAAVSFEMMFEPIGVREQDINYGVLVSRFQQPFGLFYGWILHRGTRICFTAAPGVVEEHFARW